MSTLSELNYTVITAPCEVSLSVFSGFEDREDGAIEYAEKLCDGKNATYYFDLPCGNYHYLACGVGYNTHHKNFIVTDENLKNGGKRINADPGKLSADRRYEANPERTNFSLTDEFLRSPIMNMDDFLSRFPGLLDTPAFDEGKANAQFTSQEEMEAFIKSHCEKCDTMHIFVAGKTQMNKDIYLTVHTTEDILGKELEETAEILKGSGKPTICMYGLIHGLEPSGGEGPLATIGMLASEYGKTILRDVNVLVMPWINGDGAEGYLYGTPDGCPNLNRYNLSCEYAELKATHRVYNLFMPEIVTHCHEKGLRNNGGIAETGTAMDVGLDISVNKNNTPEICDLSKDMMKHIIELSAQDGFRMDRHEQADVSGQYPVVDMNYFGLRGSVSFLIEVPGIRAPKDNYARRTASHFVVMKNLINYAITHSKEIMQTVVNDRKATAEKGKVYNPREMLTLRHGQNDYADWSAKTPLYSMTDGSLVDGEYTSQVVFWETPLAQRTRPTAYVIPANLEQIDFILNAADYSAIKYYKISAEEKLTLRQYCGTVESADLGDEQDFSFEKGAYLFPMAQDSGNALAMLMEPDVYRTGNYAISLAQGERLEVCDIYRCERRL